MYDLCVFTCIIFIFVFRCTHVQMSYVLNSYLLTYFFPQKKLTTFFLIVALETEAANAVSLSNKTNKAVRYGNIFIFCSLHTITEAKQYAELEPGQWIFQPWCSTATGSMLPDSFHIISLCSAFCASEVTTLLQMEMCVLLVVVVVAYFFI